MLVLSRKPEQSLHLGDNITVTILAIDGDRVKLGIEAPRSVSVLRHEVYSQIQEANVAAATSNSVSDIVASLRRRTSTPTGVQTT